VRTLRAALREKVEGEGGVEELTAENERLAGLVRRFESEARKVQNERDALENLVSSERQRVLVVEGELSKLREEMASSSSSGASTSTSSKHAEDNKILTAELTRLTSSYTTLQRQHAALTNEVQRLRPVASKAEVLREEARELKEKVRRADVLRQRVGELEGEVERLMGERERLLNGNALGRYVSLFCFIFRDLC
jgi:predicted  nucleic acid-binding Zn-ribbon protein